MLLIWWQKCVKPPQWLLKGFFLDQLKEENLADVQLTQVRLKTDYQTGFCVHFVNPLSIEYYDISLLSDHRFLNKFDA